jgi:hypothetical protein
MSEWTDEYGFYHLTKNPKPDETENPLLFTATYYILKKALAREDVVDYGQILRLDNLASVKGVYKTTVATPYTKMGISHDDATGWISLLHMYGLRGRIQDFKFSWRSHWKPWDLAYFLAVKLRCKRVPWITRVVAEISCRQTHKVRGVFTIPKTDGKILALLRALAFNDLDHMSRITKIIQREWHKEPAPDYPLINAIGGKWQWQSWFRVFKAYYRRTDHPNVEFAKILTEQQSPKKPFSSL